MSTKGQKVRIELLHGATGKEVFKATLSYVEQHQSGLKTAMAKEAAADALMRSGFALHGLGVDMAEGIPKVFQAGNVICYEPLFSARGQAFFEEDTFLITAASVALRTARH
jgi:hypothetical protein